MIVGLFIPIACVTAAQQQGLFHQFGPDIITQAVSVRNNGISPGEASSVASVIASKGMMPVQFTELARMGQRILENPKSIDPTSLNVAAGILAVAYTSMHTQASYSSYVDYVKQHSSIYNLEKFKDAGSAGNAIKGLPRYSEGEMISIYGSLMENSEGRHAIETFTNVVGSYMKDFGVHETGQRRMAEFIYNLL